MYYIESKATENDRFDFNMLTKTQHDGLLSKAKIPNVFAWVIVLFASYKRAFVINIEDLAWMESSLDKHSLNINRIDQWPIPYCEVETILNTRKNLLDYTGEIEQYIPERRKEV